MLSTTTVVNSIATQVIGRSLISSTVLKAALLARPFTRRYSSVNRTPMQGVTRRYKSSFADQDRKPEMNIENALFMNYKMSQAELETYNHGLRLKYLKEKLVEQRASIEELERAVNEFKSNFL